MRTFFLWCAVLALGIGTAQAEGVFRWVDKAGGVHYGDKPEAEAQQVEEKKFKLPHEGEGAGLPYETRRAQERFPVTLYVADNCVELCQSARNFLTTRGIPFSEKKLLTLKDVNEFRELSGGDDLPTLSVGKNYLRGFFADQWNSELDVAGYPKTAPYRPQTAKPATPPATTGNQEENPPQEPAQDQAEPSAP